jgi:ATP-dependent protease HslVU (ClpYQ) peptidase subunit
MTCIVALEVDGQVYMGSDRAGSNGFTTLTVAAPKVFRNGPLLVGYTSSFRMGQLLQYGLRVPTESPSWDVDRWVSQELMAAVRATFGEGGWNEAQHGVARGGNWLAAIAGRLYEIQANYAFIRSVTGEYAIGSGEYHALGSLHATRNLGWLPETRILAALNAAAEHVTTVSGPFDLTEQAA